jgi:essential nuclear protein 1
MMDAMLPANVAERRTLADLIFAKLDSAQADTLAAVKNIRQGEVIVDCPTTAGP